MPNSELIREAISALANTPGFSMSAASLAEDVFLLACAFQDDAEFMTASASTQKAIEQLAARTVSTSKLKYALEGWNSYHYQHRIAQGAKADCRIVFKQAGNDIVVLGFGHRSIPSEIYERMEEVRIARI